MSAAALAAVGLSFSSCSMDLLPLNDVVLENYWTDKKDVESVVTSCYASMQENKYVEKMIVWGEDRSDNVKQGSKNNYPADLKYLLQGSIKTTNGYLDWLPFYTTINRCNTVLYYAPQVAAKDPNYTSSDLRVTEAECKFIRSLSYLTLIKSFKNVPLVLDPSIDDTKDFQITQTPFEVVLDTLIKDINDCKDYAPRRYSDLEKNTGRVTRAAMYSLLAELYLWRASDANLTKDQQNEYYRKCIECCDFVTNFKIQQYEDNEWQGINLRDYVDKEVYSEYGYPLLAEERTVGTNQSGPLATNWIFLEGNAFETIFEIAYISGGTLKTNKDVSDHYGSSSSEQLVIANEKMLETVPKDGSTYDDTKLFSVPSDYRSIASFYFNETNGGYNIYKYVLSTNYAGMQNSDYGSVGSKYTASKKTQSYNSNESMNWIIYRLSEIMLFRAEAEMELAFNMSSAEDDSQNEQVEEPTPAPSSSKMRKSSVALSGKNLSTPEELKQDAFNLISAVYRRSNPIVKNQAKYAPTMPTDHDAFVELLMNERRREFLFEGKRYFDLVRLSRREGNTRAFRKALSQKYGEAGASVAIKMVQMDFMYLPVSKKQMKVNPNLVQNPCYLDEEENQKN